MLRACPESLTALIEDPLFLYNPGDVKFFGDVSSKHYQINVAAGI
jgi:hypothetical protein